MACLCLGIRDELSPRVSQKCLIRPAYKKRNAIALARRDDPINRHIEFWQREIYSHRLRQIGKSDEKLINILDGGNRIKVVKRALIFDLNHNNTVQITGSAIVGDIHPAIISGAKSVWHRKPAWLGSAANFSAP